MPTSASPKARQRFDYTELDITTSKFVQQQTGEIRVLMRRTVESIFEVGQRLIAVKARLGHGRYGLWLAAEFEWSQDTADNFIHVAERLGQNPKFSDFNMAASALYVLFAPSIPEAAREEAVARSRAGEFITHKDALAIKQKYAQTQKKLKPQSAPKQEPKSELKLELQPVSQSPPIPTPEVALQSRPKPQIVAILPPKQPNVESKATNVLLSQPVSTLQGIQQPLPVSTPDVHGEWWQLGGKHLVYCGEPNSREFLERFTETVQLLFAFPSDSNWQPGVRGKARIIVDEYLLQTKNSDQLDEFLESNVLFNSNLKDTVVSCFLPSPDIITVISRLDRRGILADPNLKRCNAIISDWKKAGMKVERLS